MLIRLPPLTYLLSVAGLVPFIVCGIAAVSKAGSQATAMAALIGYGAVILAFLGGVHWGFALQPADAALGGAPTFQRSRLLLGVVPSLIGWAALLLSLLVSAEFGLVLLILGFLGTVWMESRWARRELVPSGYMALRWGVSIVVLITLVTVLGLRLIGASIIF